MLKVKALIIDLTFYQRDIHTRIPTVSFDIPDCLSTILDAVRHRLPGWPDGL